MRIVILTEDYCGQCLIMTDCRNEELYAILKKVLENDENGIGKTVTELCEELFPNNYMLEIGCTEQSEYAYISELNYKVICSESYLSFSVVQNEFDL